MTSLPLLLGLLIPGYHYGVLNTTTTLITLLSPHSEKTILPYVQQAELDDL